MNDPHIETLTYEVRTKESVVTFDDPPPLTGEANAFRYRLEGGILTVEMKEHHATAESARLVVEGFLRSWAMSAALGLDRMPMEFVFKEAKRIDRNPPPRTSGNVYMGEVAFVGSGTLTATVVGIPPALKHYPVPPSGFRASPDVETMWHRYQQHIDGKETYQTMGYFCLSLIQWSTGIGKGARGEASRRYKIDRDVLDKLGVLTSERGTSLDARKLEQGSTLVPLTAAEHQWIRAAVKTLIRRKGEYDFDPAAASSLKQITMRDLPTL
jgi:hypothetical protein